MILEGIVLAAGASSRAGCFKPELQLGDRTLIGRSVEGMSAVCSRVIVVGGFNIRRLNELLKSYHNTSVVENANWQSGMFSSVQTGLASVDSDKVFLLPADIPFVPPDVYARLLSTETKIAVPTFDGRRGHPILLDRETCREILNEPAHSNLRDVIRRIGSVQVPVVHREILFDIDTVEDVSAALENFVNEPQPVHAPNRV